MTWPLGEIFIFMIYLILAKCECVTVLLNSQEVAFFLKFFPSFLSNIMSRQEWNSGNFSKELK